MPLGTTNSPSIDDGETTVKTFVVTQIAAMAPFAACVLFPPAAIPVAAVSIGVLAAKFGKPYSSK